MAGAMCIACARRTVHGMMIPLQWTAELRNPSFESSKMPAGVGENGCGSRLRWPVVTGRRIQSATMGVPIMKFVCPHCGANAFRLLSDADGKPAAECLNCGKASTFHQSILPDPPSAAATTMSPDAKR
jgi:uncharacterized protein (DUF983 family)